MNRFQQNLHEQKIINETMNQINNQQASNNFVQPSYGNCPQCGLIHPPLRQGERCPNAAIKIKDEKGNELKINTDKYLITLKNIIISQIEKKNYDENKIDQVFKDLTINTIKFLEDYK